MASGPAFKIPKIVEGQIRVEYRYKDEHGALTSGEKVIIDAEDVNWAKFVGQEVMNLLNTGELEFPEAASVSVNLRRESLTDQMESDKYTYSLSSQAKFGKFMAYLNGQNVTEDVELSADGLSFTFDPEYPGDIFVGSKLFVDYIEVG